MRFFERIAVIVAIATSLSGVSAAAGEVGMKRDHLVPEMSDFAFGGRTLHAGPPDVFRALYDAGIVVRVYADLSFWGSYGLGIQETGKNYRIVYYEKRLSDKPVKPTRCDAPLDSTLAKRAIAAWRIVLLGTRFSDDVNLGLDGASYHFSMMEEFDVAGKFKEHQPLYGQIWSPDPGSQPAQLVELAGGLADICRTNEPAKVDALKRKLAAIANQLISGNGHKWRDPEGTNRR